MTDCDRKHEGLNLSLVGLGSSCCSLPSKPTSPPGSNKPNLLPWRSITPNSTSMTNVLVVSSSMRMLNGVHSHTTNLRPAVSLDPEFVVCITSLEKRFLSPSSTGNLTNHCSATAWDYLLGT